MGLQKLEPDPDELSEMMREHYAAVEEEFAMVKNGDYSQVVDKAKEKVAKKFGRIVNKMIDLAENAESESVQLQAQKACIMFLAGKIDEAGKGSGVDKLIAKLMEDD